MAFRIVRKCMSEELADRQEGAQLFAGFATGYLIERNIPALVRLVGQIDRAATSRKSPSIPGGWSDVKLRVLQSIRDYLQAHKRLPCADEVQRDDPDLNRRTVNEHLAVVREELKERLRAVD